MYRIVGRILDGNSVIGFQMMDIDNGGNIVNMLYEHVNELGKRGMIQDCKTSGGQLSGTNGFQLKTLPSVQVKQNKRKALPLSVVNRIIHAPGGAGTAYTVGYILNNGYNEPVSFGDTVLYPNVPTLIARNQLRFMRQFGLGDALQNAKLVSNKREPDLKILEHKGMGTALIEIDNMADIAPGGKYELLKSDVQTAINAYKEKRRLSALKDAQDIDNRSKAKLEVKYTLKLGNYYIGAALYNSSDEPITMFNGITFPAKGIGFVTENNMLELMAELNKNLKNAVVKREPVNHILYFRPIGADGSSGGYPFDEVQIGTDKKTLKPEYAALEKDVKIILETRAEFEAERLKQRRQDTKRKIGAI